MKFFHRHRGDKPDESDGTAAAELPGLNDYDAQADLALPSNGGNDAAATGFIPFAGELAPGAPAAGYDIDRDTGVG